MKKLCALMMCLALALVTGCSGISREEYEALMAENSKLKSDCERVLTEKNDLAKDMSSLKVENESLLQELNQKQEKNDNFDYCFDICTWMLGRPQSSIVKTETSKLVDNVDIETTYYMEDSDFTMKAVHSINGVVSAEMIAAYLYSYEKTLGKNAQRLIATEGVTELINIYRFANGNVIMSSFWYIDNNNLIQHRTFWAFYGKDIIDIFDKLSEKNN